MTLHPHVRRRFAPAVSLLFSAHAGLKPLDLFFEPLHVGLELQGLLILFQGILGLSGLRVGVAQVLDRKSTRLNSSHT